MKKILLLSFFLIFSSSILAMDVEHNLAEVESNQKINIREFKFSLNPFKVIKDLGYRLYDLGYYLGKTPLDTLCLFKNLLIKFFRGQKNQVINDLCLILKDVLSLSYEVGLGSVDIVILFMETISILFGCKFAWDFFNSTDTKILFAKKCISCEFAPLLGIINKAPGFLRCSVFCKVLEKLRII